jgi:hypothetical protein
MLLKDLNVFYPPLKDFECDGLQDIVWVNPVVQHTTLATSKIGKNPHDRGQSKAHRKLFLQQATTLAESIKSTGRLKAILVVRDANGDWVCVDGHHRLKACKILKLRRIPVVALQQYPDAD